MPFSSYTTQPPAVIFANFSTTLLGLTETEILERQKKYGLNELTTRPVTWRHILGRQFNTPFIFLLLGAAALSFILGEKTDGIIVLGFIIINAALGFLQEFHSQKSLELLKRFVVTQARVRRITAATTSASNERHTEALIPSKNLVPGDIVIVETGDNIPADIRLVECSNLTVNESALTGESIPVEKIGVELTAPIIERHEAKNIGFSGTTVIGGKGIGVVISTGHNTALGKISRLTVETQHQSAFEKGIGKFSKFILRMILVILILLFVINLIIKGGGTNIFELLLFSVALAVSVVPEALPVVTTIALSRGAMKMSKYHIVVKRLSAIEDLGSIEVLCTDKTGTLTENKLTVQEIKSKNPDECLISSAVASSFLGNYKRETNNSFDLALWSSLSMKQKKILENYVKLGEIPFDPTRRRNSVLTTMADTKQPNTNGDAKRLIVRGAPETIIELCPKLTAPEKKDLLDWMANEGKCGRRAVAVAYKEGTCSSSYTVDQEKELTWLGIISFTDPIKSTAKTALEQAQKLGVSIKILTGDSKEVAGAVAQQVHLVENNNEVITGAELEALPEKERLAAVKKYQVFARVSPEQKYTIIQFLQREYEVGFLGEGINDAPALKMANVGIVVNDAADIARDAADIVLLKRSLISIIQGIQEGRIIFGNTVKYIKTTLISNFGNFYAVAIASLILPYLPMLPVQILLLNLLSDFPMIAIAADTMDKNELRRPRSYNIKEIILISIILGVISTIFDFIFFSAFFHRPAAVLQTNWFIGSVLTELALLFSIRTRFPFWKGSRPSAMLAALSIIGALTAIVVPLSVFGHRLFAFTAPSMTDILLIAGIVALYFILNEIVKLLYFRHTQPLEDAAGLNT